MPRFTIDDLRPDIRLYQRNSKYARKGAPRVIEQPAPAGMQSEGPCLIWTGYIRENGNAQMTWPPLARNGQKTECIPHRLVYNLYRDEDFPIKPENGRDAHRQINHLCGVRNCMNPFHMGVGSQAENLVDMGRDAILDMLRTVPALTRDAVQQYFEQRGWDPSLVPLLGASQ